MSEATDDSVAEDPVEAAPERRVPTGKTRRTTKDPDVAAAQPRAEDKPPTEMDEAPDPQPDDSAQPDDRAHQDDSARLNGEAEPDVEPEPEPFVLVSARPAGKHLLITAAVASMLFVAAGAFAGATLQPYLSDRAAVDTKLDIARTAADAITTLWTYTPDDMASLPDRSSQYLAGEFATEYRRYIDAIVEPNRQAQVTNTTQVMGTAVESLGLSEAMALVYTNSVSTSPVSKNVPSLRYLSYRLTMERHDADWLITGMNAMTKLDLTPQQ
ncbi:MULTISPECIES: mammalian cell entry protein [Mycolicibacterium]|uniref:mammalian cell entry protein n=1 Tax=Mycolicibacterium TaxID=1866885 RepID=UPI001EF38993|nr:MULTISPECIES: mammalian cell entry protein [Mycolicibacterium]